MRRRGNGFTLLELLVVIAIIGFLAATLVVATVGLKQRSKYEKANALIRRLDAACESYFTKFQDYPSDFPKLTAADKAGGIIWPGGPPKDKHLYDYLGQPLSIVVRFTGASSTSAILDPFVEFSPSEVSGPSAGVHTVQILDPWGGPVWYELPGCDHGTRYPDFSRGPSSSTNSRFDLTSAGPDGHADSFDDKLNPKDDVTNYNYP
ncbi:MAG: prepilin-type N-terminal cleavage/methylation domain-containing protein [Planctomycetes bacterium]|nr:prepilin-type N-terminal cleavage/methylation domain-containing protein [Planctomycetota bacterium]